METSELWVLVLSISTPVAGVVGFAIQVRNVRKARLENEKLLLEIAALKSAAESREHMIQKVSTQEVLRFGRDEILFSVGRGPNPGPDDGPGVRRSSKLIEVLITGVFVGIAILVVAYALYDLYRLVRWIGNAL